MKSTILKKQKGRCVSFLASSPAFIVPDDRRFPGLRPLSWFPF